MPRASEQEMVKTAPCVVIHYSEVALKGKNRPLFLRRLEENIRRATRDCGVARLQRITGRLVLDLLPGADSARLAGRLGRVFGVANFGLGFRVARDLEVLEEAVAEAVSERSFRSFRIRTRRADKTFSLTSPEINRRVGGHVKAQTGAAVDLSHPELTVYIEVLPRVIYGYLDRMPGPGGLPVGVSGRVVSLLSGGIDSPVAAFRMMKRGCTVAFVHFHSYPILSRASMDKAKELAELLTRYQYASRLYLVPFGDIQSLVVTGVPAPLRVVVYRRLMLRIAEAVARKERASALLTGESLGQVASQTLENLVTIEAIATLPVLRPLIGLDKQEITDEARGIGTYEISIIPDQDCCTLFIPKYPATRSRVDQVAKAEEALDIPGMVRQGVDGAEVETFGYP